MLEHLYVKLDDPGCIGFYYIVWKKQKKKPTDRHINAAECPSHATTVGLGKYDVVIASSMIFTKFVTTEYCGRHIPECVVSLSI